MAISVKSFFLCGDNTKPEIRRFSVSHDDAVNYTIICEKLRSIYGEVLGTRFSIFWKDDEGDEIMASSNEELSVALASVSDGILKLYVCKDSGRFAAGQDAQGQLHPNVTCDGCNHDVRGFRYKCAICPDYDLCSACECQGIHADHLMMRIPASEYAREANWNGPWQFRARGCHGRHWRRAFRHAGRTEVGIPRASEQGTRRGSEDEISRANQQDAQPQLPISPNLGHFINQLMLGLGGSVINPAVISSLFGHRQPTEAATASNPETGAPSEGTHAASSPPMNPQDYLKTVGETIAAILDPMGIDVEVDVEHHGVRERCNMPLDAEGSKRHAADAEIKDPSEAKKGESTEQGSSATQRGESASPDDWVDIGMAVDDMQSTSEHPTALPQLHTDPAVAMATAQMLSMGFDDDQGWLTRLLEIKQGSIDQVLETLSILNEHTNGNRDQVKQLILTFLESSNEENWRFMQSLQNFTRR